MSKTTMTPEQKAKKAAYMREYMRKRSEAMPPDQREVMLAAKRLAEKKRRDLASPASRETQRTRNAKWMREMAHKRSAVEHDQFLAHRRETEAPHRKRWYANGGKEKAKIYYWRNPDRARATQAIYREKTKRLVMEAYGGACVCCGENELAFLSIDHIKGDGAQHRKSGLKASGMSFYQWLKKNDFPQGFQVLCMNCNVAKRTGSECPHKSLVRRILNLVTSK